MDAFCNCSLIQVFETKQPEIKLGGIVSMAENRVSKNGNPWMKFILEDYEGSMEIALFGDDYVRMNQYVEVGRFLHVTGKTQNKWSSTDLEFKATNIRLLNELRDKLCKEVKVSLALQSVNAQMIAKINELVVSHPGNCTFVLNVSDPDERIEVSLLSRTVKVNPANTLIRGLEQLEGVACKVA